MSATRLLDVEGRSVRIVRAEGIHSPGTSEPIRKMSWACLVILAPDDGPQPILKPLRDFIKNGRCVAVSLVGERSEEAHDAFDDLMLEEENDSHAVTTWHSRHDLKEAMETAAAMLESVHNAVIVVAVFGDELDTVRVERELKRIS